MSTSFNTEDKETAKRLLELMRQTGLFSKKDIEQIETEDEIAELTGSSHLINTKKENAPLIIQAARDTGYDIYIEQEAFDRNLHPLPDMIAVYTKNIYKDHGRFWKRYTELHGQ